MNEEVSGEVSRSIMVNAGLTSGAELARALVEGRHFWTEGRQKVWFDLSKSNPFRLGDMWLQGLWGEFANLQEEVLVSELNLKQKLSSNLHVLALVSQSDFNPEASAAEVQMGGAHIRVLAKVSGTGFLDSQGETWGFAKEVGIAFV